MGIFRSMLDTLSLRELRNAPTAPVSPSSIIPPARWTRGGVTPETALTISTVFRGIQILATAAGQLTIDEWRGATPIDRSALVANPDPHSNSSAFFESTVTSMATTGNAYWRHLRSPMSSEIIALKLLPAHEVAVGESPDGRLTYTHKGREYPAADISHLQLLRIPGRPVGLGPIQAAQVELRGAIDARDYGALWLSETNIPNGILSTDQVLTPELAKTYKSLWNGAGDEVTGHDIRVIGNGLKYSPLMLKPSDVQFLETRQFNTTEIARLFGIPASLMLASVEGKSETYSNVEQEWIAFIRFTLMAYLREIEQALSTILPRGRSVRFNVDGLLRTDTATRYKAHALSLDPDTGWATLDEVRAQEGMTVLTDAQRAEITNRATKEPTNV